MDVLQAAPSGRAGLYIYIYSHHAGDRHRPVVIHDDEAFEVNARPGWWSLGDDYDEVLAVLVRVYGWQIPMW